MKQLLAFYKATLLGGTLFVLPAWLDLRRFQKGREDRIINAAARA